MTDAHHRAAMAERAARAGGIVARERFRDDIRVETKANKNDLVTDADHDAQRQVVATVRQEFPDDPFVCEEEEMPVLSERNGGVTHLEAVPGTGPAWVVDPIDGTANYVRGIRTWGTAIAAVVDGEAVAAATYLPSLGDVYSSGPESATRDGSALAVSDRTDPETFAVAPVGWWDPADRGEFGDVCSIIVERFGDLRRIGSLQATLALVADGGLEAAITPGGTTPWDTMAGVHMIRRAGGTVTDVHGNPWRHDSEGFVASNGTAHDEVLDAVQSVRDAE